MFMVLKDINYKTHTELFTVELKKKKKENTIDTPFFYTY